MTPSLVTSFVIKRLIPVNKIRSSAKFFLNMARRSNKLRRLWRKSPRLAFAYLRRKVTRQAKRILPVDEYKNWLGEEMRPFNSLHN